MKLTPEQKAFRDYGKLLQLWNDSRRGAFWREESHEDIRREIIQKVLQKRAACRAWAVPDYERICENCAHEGTHPYATPCSECFRCPFAQAYEGFSDNWEPRKEGE